MNDKVYNKVYGLIKNGMPLDELSKKLELSELETRGMLEILKTTGKNISIGTVDGVEVILKKTYKKVQKGLKPRIDECNHSKFLVISDTHFGNNRQQLHLLNKLYEEAYEKEIDTVLHVGDLVDGDYSSIRKEQPKQVFLHGFDEQASYVVDMYPKVEGITTKFILGSHDETHYKNGHATIGEWIPRCRKDMIYLGQDQETIDINKVKITLDHPGDGSAYALSYKAQKRIEEMETGNKPNLLLIGHYHKEYYFVYRNVHCIEVPCLCDKTNFQIKRGIYNTVGGYFVDIYSDNNGNIQYICPEPRLFNREEFWEEGGKDMKKVKRLVI